MTMLTRLARERGVTLVTVTHDNRIFSFADRLLHLEDGRFTAESVPSIGPSSFHMLDLDAEISDRRSSNIVRGDAR
jgi:ABC-type lipoprotein export system ATPase subunit